MKTAPTSRRTNHQKRCRNIEAPPASLPEISAPTSAHSAEADEKPPRPRSLRFQGIATWLRHERKVVLDETQERLAQACQRVSEDTISNAENGYAIQRNNFREIVAGLNRIRGKKSPPLPPFDAEQLWVELRAVTYSRAGTLAHGAVAEVAYRIWCELSTRKIGLELDFVDDLITEVYDSWYACLQVIRELMKGLPVTDAGHRDAAIRVMSLCEEIINAAMRPHLTRWQAEFRRWVSLNSSAQKFAGKRPQEIERQFPKFEELQTDLRSANARLIAHEARLHEMLFGSSRGERFHGHGQK